MMDIKDTCLSDEEITIDTCLECLFEDKTFTTDAQSAIKNSSSYIDDDTYNDTYKCLVRCCNKFPQLCRSQLLEECKDYVKNVNGTNQFTSPDSPPNVCSCFYPNWYYENILREKFRKTGTEGLPGTESDIKDLQYDNAELMYELSVLKRDCLPCFSLNLRKDDIIYYDGSDEESSKVSKQTLPYQTMHISCNTQFQQPCIQNQKMINQGGTTYEDSDLIFQSQCNLQQRFSLDDQTPTGLLIDTEASQENVKDYTLIIILSSILIIILLLIWSFM